MNVDALTLTTHHGEPVLVINGIAYGPSDLTPAGEPAAMLAYAAVMAFIAPLPADAREMLMRTEYEEAARTAASELRKLA